MAYISSIGDRENCCLTFNKLDNALKVVNALLFDEECANDRTGQYAIMVSLEEHNVRLDIVSTFDSDPVVFGSAYYVEKAITEGEEDGTD